jgi:hypothetical protein
LQEKRCLNLDFHKINKISKILSRKIFCNAKELGKKFYLCRKKVEKWTRKI